MHRLALRLAILALTAAPVVIVAQSRPATAAWPHWRGPGHTGATTANVPLTWSDTSNVRWKVEIPGRGHSTPVASGDRLFLTTAVPTGKKTDVAPAAGGRGGLVAARAPAKSIASRCSRSIAPAARSSGSRPRPPRRRTRAITIMYGSFASNAPATDGQRVYAFFGSRGLYVYDLNGKLAVAEGLSG